MSLNRYAKKTDANQKDIVKLLRAIPGVTVVPGHDDILCGFRGVTFWFEVKSGVAVSKKTGKVFETKKKKSQKKLETEFTGHYKIVSSFNEILDEIGL